MKNLFITAFILCCAATLSYAQYDAVATMQERQYMVMDGNNPNFVHAQQQSPQRLAIGLPTSNEANEGIYELRGDTCIWRVESSYGNDELLAHITTDSLAGNVVFSRIEPFSMSDKRVDTLGVYDFLSEKIYAQKDRLIATIQPTGEVESSSGKVYLRVDKVDRKLLAFFFLHYYFPVNHPEEH